MEDRQNRQGHKARSCSSLNRSEEGSGLISVMIALGIGLVVAQFVISSGSRQLDISLKSQNDYEVASIQRTVVEQLDCAKTLGITDSSTFPLSCSSYSSSLPLKRTDGSIINPNNKIGRWSVSADCDGDEIKVGISKPGRDSITKKLWSSLVTADDAFRGSSDFCKNELGAGPFSSNLICFTASRSQNTVEVPGSKASYIEAYNDVTSTGEILWGLSCKAPFVRVGCFMDGPSNTGVGTTIYDADLRPHPNGCNSDDEEWILEQKINVSCCSVSG